MQHNWVYYLFATVMFITSISSAGFLLWSLFDDWEKGSKDLMGMTVVSAAVIQFMGVCYFIYYT